MASLIYYSSNLLLIALEVIRLLVKFISAYRKTYSTNHLLTTLIKNWRRSLDQNKFVGAVLMDLIYLRLLTAFLMTKMQNCTHMDFQARAWFSSLMPKKA